MKTRSLYLVTALTLANASLSGAASYSVNNGSGSSATGIADFSGTAFQGNGVVGVGILSSDDISSFHSASQFLSVFTLYGNTTAFAPAGSIGSKGIFSLTVAGNSASPTFAGKDIILMVGNGTNFANSTRFLVLDTGRNFLATDEQSGTPIDVVINASSSLLFGLTSPDIKTTTTDSSVNPGFLTGLPEPSTAMLAALGAVGLMRRRR